MKSDTLMLLELEHLRLGQVLDVIDGELGEAETQGEIREELVQEALGYLLEYPDRCHHPKEDLIAARLQSALGEQAPGGELEADHRALHDLTVEATGVVGAERGVDQTLESLRRYVKAYRQHIDHENEHFFPTVLRSLTQRDFDEIDFQVFDAADPVFDPNAEGRFRALRQKILEEAS